MAKYHIGQDPVERQKQRSARASTAAGEGVEQAIAAYRERSKASHKSIPTPGAPPPAPEPTPVAEAPKAQSKANGSSTKDERRSRK